jgi:hypothetical protein
VTRWSSPPVDAALALELLNRLRAAFCCDAIAAPPEDHALAAELREAYPLLAMLAPKAETPGVAPELLDELRHNRNKAVRRRGWRH